MTAIYSGETVRSLIDYGEGRLDRGGLYEVASVSSDGLGMWLETNGSRVYVTRREVEKPLLDRHTIDEADSRLWRVSAFPMGWGGHLVSANDHRTSKLYENAEKNFLKACRKLGTKYQCVVLHQGNFKYNSYKIYLRRDAEEELEQK